MFYIKELIFQVKKFFKSKWYSKQPKLAIFSINFKTKKELLSILEQEIKYIERNIDIDSEDVNYSSSFENNSMIEVEIFAVKNPVYMNEYIKGLDQL